MALYIDIGLDDVLRVDGTYIALERKSGSRARLKIEGKNEVELMRKVRAQMAQSNSFPGKNPVRQDTGD